MKREIYEVSLNGIVFDVRSKWNACIRSTEAKIRQIANEKGESYKLIDSFSEKKDFGFVKGFRTWQGENGNIVKFEIEKK